MFSRLAGKPPRRLPVCDLSGHVPDTLQPVCGAPSLRLLAQASVAVPACWPAALTVPQPGTPGPGPCSHSPASLRLPGPAGRPKGRAGSVPGSPGPTPLPFEGRSEGMKSTRAAAGPSALPSLLSGLAGFPAG